MGHRPHWNTKGNPFLIVLGVLTGMALGLGLFTFGYARGFAYMTDDPAACANCHVMRDQYSGWMKGSHRTAAVCNDCHSPSGLVPKYATKMRNGFFHSLAFTTGRFPEVIQVTAFNHAITERACIKCHSEIVAGIESVRAHGQEVQCIQCHARVGHQ